MPLLLTLLVAFLSLVWLGLMLINLAGTLRSNESYEPKGSKERVLVMVPCKGKDLGLENNLKTLKDQDYSNYDVVAIVDSERDGAVPIIKRAGIKYILSSKSYAAGGGKVRAMLTAMKRYRNYDIYVNVDSDVRCNSNHIRELIAPLQDKRIGVSTAYPYFVPHGGFWSDVKMVWGFVGNGMMESKLTRFVWGGSMAFRKSLMHDKDFDTFRKALSDDMAIAYFVRERGQSIAYVNKNTINVDTDDTFPRFIEWANRQTALSILGSRRVLYYGVAFYGAQALLLIFGVLLSLFSSYWYVILLLPFLIGLVKTYKRSRHAYLSIIPICLIMNFVFLANLITASRMTHIQWRGAKYILQNPF